MIGNEKLRISCHISGSDSELFLSIINQGIDARLEAFTESDFNYKGDRLMLVFHPDERSILLRRLSELDDDLADSWITDIIETEYDKECYL